MYVKYTIYYKDNLNQKVIDSQFDDGKDYYGESESKGSVNRTSKQISNGNEESRSRQTNSQWDNGKIENTRTTGRNVEISNLNKEKGSIKEQGNTSVDENSRENAKELAPTSSFFEAKTDIPYYTPEEVEKLISVLQLEPIKYQAIILLALDLGCRRGELTGLTWEDIDFETGRVQINKTTQYAYGEIFEKGTKTANSERVNYISQTTIEILKKWQKEQLKQKLLLGSKWQESKRVFTTDYGADIHPDTPTKILGKIINKYGLKKNTFHGLRHTNVTLMIAKGIQTQIISRKVGHSSVQTTDRVYSHFFEDEFKNVPNVMEEFLTVKAN